MSRDEASAGNPNFRAIPLVSSAAVAISHRESTSLPGPARVPLDTVGAPVVWAEVLPVGGPI